MVNYSNGKIYKIIGTDPLDKCYVGSTTKQYLSQRFVAHREGYQSWKKNRGSRKNVSSYEIFEKYGLENCKIVLLELCPVSTREELLQREQHYIDTLDCVNKKNAIITDEQRREIKRKWERSHKSQIQQYYQDNKAVIIARSAARYEKNREAITESYKVDVHCDKCGYSVRKSKMSRHRKTKTHEINLLNKISAFLELHG